MLINSFRIHESFYCITVNILVWNFPLFFQLFYKQSHQEIARPVPGSQFWSKRLRLPPTSNIWCVSGTKPPCGVPFDPYMIIIISNTFNCQSDILVHTYQLCLFLEDSQIIEHWTCHTSLHIETSLFENNRRIREVFIRIAIFQATKFCSK